MYVLVYAALAMAAGMMFVLMSVYASSAHARIHRRARTDRHAGIENTDYSYAIINLSCQDATH